jgi:hypothetical protein
MFVPITNSYELNEQIDYRKDPTWISWTQKGLAIILAAQAGKEKLTQPLTKQQRTAEKLMAPKDSDFYMDMRNLEKSCPDWNQAMKQETDEDKTVELLTDSSEADEPTVHGEENTAGTLTSEEEEPTTYSSGEEDNKNEWMGAKGGFSKRKGVSKEWES